MKQRAILAFSLFVFLVHCTKTLSQSSPAAAPAPAAAPKRSPHSPRPLTPPAAAPPALVPVQNSRGPLNVVKVLKKAGHFSYFIRLIKSTQEDIQFFSQLNSSSDGITIFAPTDDAFLSLIKSGTFNSLSDQDKIELIQFHVIPRLISMVQFQTVSNPLRTLAGAGSRFTLNVITSDSLVNVSSILTNTTVSAIVYTDNQVAIYQVDKVLLPLDLFAPKPPAQAPAPPKKPKFESAESPVVPKDASGTVLNCIVHNSLVMVGVGMVAAIVSL